MMDINLELQKVYLQWAKEKLEPCIDDENDKSCFSRPFICGVTEEYAKSKNRIMIVGQETMNYFKYTDDLDFNWLQNFACEYLKSQTIKGCKLHPYSNSAFWNFFRKLKMKASEYELCWDNVNKLERYRVGQNGKTYTEHLAVSYVDKLNGPIDGITLFKRSMDITNPGSIVFVCGPSFTYALASYLGVDCNELEKFKPNLANPCTDISGIVGVGRKVFWSYHPGYLQRKKLIDKVVDVIVDSLN